MQWSRDSNVCIWISGVSRKNAYRTRGSNNNNRKQCVVEEVTVKEVVEEMLFWCNSEKNTIVESADSGDGSNSKYSPIAKYQICQANNHYRAMQGEVSTLTPPPITIPSFSTAVNKSACNPLIRVKENEYSKDLKRYRSVYDKIGVWVDNERGRWEKNDSSDGSIGRSDNVGVCTSEDLRHILQEMELCSILLRKHGLL